MIDTLQRIESCANFWDFGKLFLNRTAFFFVLSSNVNAGAPQEHSRAHA